MKNEKALLAVSFGTSHDDTRALTIDAFEKDLREAFPDRTFYRAWTSGVIRRILRERDGLIIDSVSLAMERMLEDGIKDVLVQPSHILTGEEYEKVTSAVEKYKARFEKISVGLPLISCEDDAVRVAGILGDAFNFLKDDEMLVLMGHGAARCDFPAYEILQKTFREKGCKNVAIGTVEFDPGIAPVLECVKDLKPSKVYLTPLLIVAGDHAKNDMAGNEPDSWKNTIKGLGPDVEVVLRGLCEYAPVREMFVEHAKAALR